MKKRREIAGRYLNELKNVILPYQHPDTNSSWHLFVIQVNDRKIVHQRLKVNNILTQVHYIPVNEQPFYTRKELQNSNTFYQYCLSLPIYVDLIELEQMEVVRLLG